jgi:hypothetical protein
MTHRRARSERTNAIITNPVQHHVPDRAMNPTAAGIDSGKPRSHRPGAAATTSAGRWPPACTAWASHTFLDQKYCRL